MKTYLRLLAFAVTIVSIYFFSPWQHVLYYFTPVPLTVQQQLDESIEQGIDGIILYVDDGKGAPNLYASGLKNRTNNVVADPNALFKIASIGKLYEAVAVAKLSALGLLSLDKTIADYLPEIASRIVNSQKITIRMMVQHRSGLANYTDHDDFSWSEPLPDTYKLIFDAPADFEPGTDHAYSNTNYFLLKKVMSAVLETESSEFITSHILEPLSLNDTFLSMEQVDQTRMMSGYYVGYENDFKALKQGYVASAENVGRFIRALNDGSVFVNKVEQETYNSLYKKNHDGWVLGYQSKARYLKENDTVLVQFINTTGDDTILLADIIFGRLTHIIKVGE